MSKHARYTDQEKAEAADRLIDVLEQARITIGEAGRILSEGREGVDSMRHPKFGFAVDGVPLLLNKARDSLYEAHKVVAVYAYDQHRKMHKERLDVWSSLP